MEYEKFTKLSRKELETLKVLEVLDLQGGCLAPVETCCLVRRPNEDAVIKNERQKK